MDKFSNHNGKKLSCFKKVVKQGRNAIITEYSEKIHTSPTKSKKVKPVAVCKMALSRDEDWKNIFSQEGLSLQDRCCALLANHTEVQVALEKLPSEIKCPDLPAESADYASESKKRKKRKPPRKDGDDVSDSSEKENCDSGQKRSSLVSSDSAIKRPYIVHEKDGIVESLRKPSKRKKTSAKDGLLGEEKGERECLKKGKLTRMKENASLMKEHLAEEILEMQDVGEFAISPSTERSVVKAKKRKNKRRLFKGVEKYSMSNKLSGMTNCLKGQEDDSGGSEGENCKTWQKSFILSSGGTLHKKDYSSLTRILKQRKTKIHLARESQKGKYPLLKIS